MIIDSIHNSARYENMNRYFKQAFDYLKTLDTENLVPGKTELDGDALFVNIVETDLKKKDAAKLEIHDYYIDIQFPVSAMETFGWKDREKCKNSTIPFDSAKDIEFYGDEPTTYFSLQPGEFAVFFPEDGHAPCIGEGKIKKVIVKVRV